jgi:hypothetical protein
LCTHVMVFEYSQLVHVTCNIRKQMVIIVEIT